MTSDLTRRLYEHKNGVVEGFSKKYKTHKLVYVEEYDNVNDCISREKQLKGWIRAKKNALVESINPCWNDLSVQMSS